MEAAREALQHRFATYDKGGEEHYNLISALHKAVRGSDPDGALYWLARMIDGGEDPLYIARRLVRMASEDIGLADPGRAGGHDRGPRRLPLPGLARGRAGPGRGRALPGHGAQVQPGLRGLGPALQRARETPGEPVPLHIRNAPTSLMKDLGYGKGYRYDPAEPDGVSAQRYLPDRLEGERYYTPGRFGHEKTVAARLEWWEAKRREAAGRDVAATDDDGADPTGRGRAREDEEDEGEGRTWIRRPARLALALSLAVTAGGCLAFSAPRCSVAEVRLASLGSTGGTIGVTLEVDNPNGFALESQGFRYRLAFADDAEGRPGRGSRWPTARDDRTV